MNSAGIRARLKKLEQAKSSGGTLDWRLFTGEVEVNLDAPPFPGFGATWREIINETPRDPLEMALARLHAECPDKVPLPLPPDDAAGAAPASSGVGETARYEPDYPPGYVPEPEPAGGYEYEPLPEGDDDAASD